MDIGTRPISDHHNQAAFHHEQQQEQQLCNEYHNQTVSNSSENPHDQQNIRPIASQVHYFYQAVDGQSYLEGTGSHSTDLTRTQLVVNSEQLLTSTAAATTTTTAATASSIIAGEFGAESGDPRVWFSSKQNGQSSHDYLNQGQHQPVVGYTDSIHDNHSSKANISQPQPLLTSLTPAPPSHLPPVLPTLVQPELSVVQHPPVTNYMSQDSNNFCSNNNNNQTSADYNYALYQRNTWHSSSNSDAQFATQQYYNYNYYEGQQQHQLQQHYHQQHQINGLAQQQQDDKQHSYYSNNNSPHQINIHQQNHPIEEQLFDNPTNFSYADRYSRYSAINQAAYLEQVNTSGCGSKQVKQNIHERCSYYVKQQTEIVNGLKPATSIWPHNQNNSSSSNHISTPLCPIPKAPNNSFQEKSWISVTNQQQQQLKAHQNKVGQEIVNKDVSSNVMNKTNSNKVTSNGTSLQRTNQCSVCGRNYARPSTLKTHLRTHTNERPFKCNVCFKTFSQAANLTAHQRVHTGERPFSCPICGRQFSQSSSVITHSRTHSGERPYRCSMCSRTFSDSSTLTKHCRIHSGEKPYQCDHCPLNFSQSGNLSRHLKLHLMNSSNINTRNGNNNSNGISACGASSTTSSSSSSTGSSNQASILSSRAQNNFHCYPKREREKAH